MWAARGIDRQTNLQMLGRTRITIGKDRQTDRQTDRQVDRRMNEQAERWTNRKTDNCSYSKFVRAYEETDKQSNWSTVVKHSPNHNMVKGSSPPYASVTTDLYYKHITMVNDVSRVISKWCHNLEHHSRVINYNPRGINYTNLWCL